MGGNKLFVLFWQDSQIKSAMFFSDTKLCDQNKFNI